MKNFTFFKSLLAPMFVLGAATGVASAQKLELKVSVSDAICMYEETVFTIDTTGTGAISSGAELKVVSTTESGVETEEKGFQLENGLLKKTISPTETTKYHVSLSNGQSSRDTLITVTVYNFKVVPQDKIICEGESVELSATVSPAGSKIEWFDEDKVTSLGDNPGAVYPKFNGPESAAKYQYKYWARPYSDLVACPGTVLTPLVVTVYRPLEGSLEDLLICEGGEVLIDAGSYGAQKYKWVVRGDTIDGSRYFQDKPSETTVYKVLMSRENVCTAEGQATVTVATNPVIAAIDTSNKNFEVVMNPDFGMPTFTYTLDNGTPTADNVFKGLTNGMHTIKVEDGNGCTVVDSFKVNNSDGVESILADEGDRIINVYTLTGALVKANIKASEALYGLKPGSYIVGNKKIVVKD